MIWRLTIRYEHSEEVLDLPDVQALRQVVQQVRADPLVDGYSYRRVVEPTAAWQRCPRCGELYLEANIRFRACRCGVPHVAHYCGPCRSTDLAPPEGEGCGPIPDDHEAINARYSRKRWYRTRPG